VTWLEIVPVITEKSVRCPMRSAVGQSEKTKARYSYNQGICYLKKGHERQSLQLDISDKPRARYSSNPASATLLDLCLMSHINEIQFQVGLQTLVHNQGHVQQQAMVHNQGPVSTTKDTQTNKGQTKVEVVPTTELRYNKCDLSRVKSSQFSKVKPTSTRERPLQGQVEASTTKTTSPGSSRSPQQKDLSRAKSKPQHN
jgi:hypothetical protein